VVWFTFETPTTKPKIMRLKEINSKVVAIATQLSETTISPSTSGSTVPIAPTVTVVGIKDDLDKINLFFRIVVFIDSDCIQSPVFSIDENKVTDFYVSFNLPEKTPTKYTAWYIEAIYPYNQFEDLTVYLLNEDPKTSRGTVTTVIIETPIGKISGY
jgi:hypothetical protein